MKQCLLEFYLPQAFAIEKTLLLVQRILLINCFPRDLYSFIHLRDAVSAWGKKIKNLLLLAMMPREQRRFSSVTVNNRIGSCKSHNLIIFLALAASKIQIFVKSFRTAIPEILSVTYHTDNLPCSILHLPTCCFSHW